MKSNKQLKYSNYVVFNHFHGIVVNNSGLLTHYKQIYKKFGNDHYFFAIEINLVDESINYSQGIIDFTDEMFS